MVAHSSTALVASPARSWESRSSDDVPRTSRVAPSTGALLSGIAPAAKCRGGTPLPEPSVIGTALPATPSSELCRPDHSASSVS